MKTHKNVALGLFLFVSLITMAQTSNLGELSILPNTQMGVVDDFNNTTTASVMNNGELFVYSNFNNDGLFSYFDSNNNGLTRFEGTSIQQITGNALSEFYNVLFNNTSSAFSFELSGDISVVNTAEFFQGIVKNDDFGGNITFEQLADHINTSNTSYVDGSVYKNGDTAFEFPIGDNGFYRSSAISTPDNSNDIFASKYFLENSDTLHPHALATGVIEFIDNTEYWTITRDQGVANVIVTLSWDTNTTPLEISNAPATAIRIVRWDAIQGFWVDEASIVDIDNQTVTTVAEVSGYGVFTLATVKEDIILLDDVIVYNGLSPNGDGNNDFFLIDGIAKYPDNTVQIFNRWGVKVFETTSYNETNNVFKGISDGRITINEKEQLPVGTYFYIVEYNPGGNQSQAVKKAGYLYINTDKN
ncbi:gliding motility-associated C-terminal domain-containing protein [Flavivirga spongiicola]|uniref:Gliding motility-associated C-terminal domain-containing protein n=1 Tax=Flavivirga spongiicola TaxID=421621 RepID=A0ABU7XQQ6_9FLAO|nr:gliding motility-associated C-terminal domain-containing protein [Flavivirga sp. MEBiC05379]MDO5978124.1 gliding motility-associated C-terminal domain-containing protein [Flavivirga sp. MEBiC05379]